MVGSMEWSQKENYSMHLIAFWYLGSYMNHFLWKISSRLISFVMSCTGKISFGMESIRTKFIRTAVEEFDFGPLTKGVPRCKIVHPVQ